MEVPQPLWVPVPMLNHSHWEIYIPCCPIDFSSLAIVPLPLVLVAVGQAGLCHTAEQHRWDVTSPRQPLPSPAVLSRASCARIWPPKLVCNSATAHLDKALNRLKKAPLSVVLQFFCSKIGDEEVGFHIRRALLSPYHQRSHPSFPAAEGREQPQHSPCQILLCCQPGWLKTSSQNFSFWKQFCLQSRLLSAHAVHRTSTIHSSSGGLT